MTAHHIWAQVKRRWYDGHTGDETLLREASRFLAETADWIDVRNMLINMAWSKSQVLNWFSEQDFPDFEEAVEEGWGWPRELEEA